jgi:hypothetical protein
MAMPVAGRPSKLGLSAQFFGSVATPPKPRGAAMVRSDQPPSAC